MLFTSETAAHFGRLGGSRSTARTRHAAFVNGLRGGRPVVAHQAKIRRREATLDPRPPIESLEGCRVAPISHEQAAEIIERYEWLGAMGHPQACYGLLGPTGEILGAVSFGRAGSQHPMVTDVSEICLERGACVHWAPKNAASFLIRHAVGLAHREHGWEIFYAYSDPDAGEIGTVYQACSWLYLGRGPRHGPHRAEWRRPGSSEWISDRQLAAHGFTGRGCWDRARAAGWVSRSRPAKHKYTWVEGVRARELRTRIEALGVFPYPKTRGR